MAIPVAQLGWMAGVVDLKGKVIRKQNKMRRTPQVVLIVESRHLAVIKELGRLTGTRAEAVKKAPSTDWYRRNCQEHCEDAHVHVVAPEWPATSRWTATGASMGVVLYNLQPFLRVDQGWDLMMEEAYESTALSGQGSGAALMGVRRLRDLGWEMPPEITGFLALEED